MPYRTFRAPGRVSLIGGQVDYHEGWIVSLAIVVAGTLGCIADYIYHHQPGQFRLPDYITPSPNSQSLYISDRWNDRVQVFDMDGHFKFTFGSSGSGLGQFGEPKQIAFDKQGNVHARISCDLAREFGMLLGVQLPQAL